MAKSITVYACPNSTNDKLLFCAAHSLRQAAGYLNIPLSAMNEHGFETARQEDVEIALWRPWAVFERPRHSTDPRGYQELTIIG